MKKKDIPNSVLSFLILLTLSICSFHANAQNFTDSNLPIVIINTDLDPVTGLPIEIPDEPKILASMKIIKHADGSRNYLTDAATTSLLNYNGRIAIEIRGSSSQTLPKKPYGLTTLMANNTTNNNVSLLGMPAQNDWILNAIAFDKTLIRDYLCYNLSRQMGNYASRTEYCEVVVNGDYKGLYILQEKIKADANRVNILKMITTDNTFPNVTGGYITKADKQTGGDPIAWTMEETNFIHDLPKPTEITTQQDAYIHGEFDRLAAQVYNSSLQDGYTSVIDVPSFVDFMLVNELGSNSDVYQSSTFFHKDRNGKLRAGPVWDMNLTFGSTFTTHSNYNVWQFANGNRVGPEFWFSLYDNGSFWCYFTKRWHELTQTGKPMNYNSLTSFIDNTVTLISEATIRENERWGTIPDQAAAITGVKDWLTLRMDWMNSNLGSFAACTDVVTPPLVITKIHYNPATAPGFTVSNDLEFIEIKNVGLNTENLSGVYFSELGTSYQFPYNTTVGANQSIILASNAIVFQNKYGFAPFGQYTRPLSNKSQKIVLADAYGNEIDKVEYFDSAPWPTQADGLGSYLQLINTSLDNNLASSWVASNPTLGVATFAQNNHITIFPNPVSAILTINSMQQINAITVLDIFGKKMKDITLNANQATLDLSDFSIGVYFLKVYDLNGGVTIEKIVKQ
jgi:hypothetical protein